MAGGGATDHAVDHLVRVLEDAPPLAVPHQHVLPAHALPFPRSRKRKHARPAPPRPAALNPFGGSEEGCRAWVRLPLSRSVRARLPFGLGVRIANTCAASRQHQTLVQLLGNISLLPRLLVLC